MTALPRIIRAMHLTRFIARFPTTRPSTLAAGMGLSVMASLAVAANRAEPRRHKPFPTVEECRGLMQRGWRLAPDKQHDQLVQDAIEVRGE